MESNIRIHEEYAHLKEAQRAALERLSTLLCTYDDQILQQKPYWEAKYTEAFGVLEQQCYAAFVRSSELRRRIALARAYMNHGAEPDAEADRPGVQGIRGNAASDGGGAGTCRADPRGEGDE